MGNSSGAVRPGADRFSYPYPSLHRRADRGAPAGLPPAMLAKLNKVVNDAIRSPLFKERFDLIGDEPAGGTPQDFAYTIKRDSARWGEVVRRSGAKID